MRHHRDDLRRLGVQRLGLCGSFQRGEADSGSDVDLLVEFVPGGVIGEATKNLSSKTRDWYPDMEWRAMAGMRDRLIHGYFGVDHEIVWVVATEKAPELREAIGASLEEEDAG